MLITILYTHKVYNIVYQLYLNVKKKKSLKKSTHSWHLAAKIYDSVDLGGAQYCISSKLLRTVVASDLWTTLLGLKLYLPHSTLFFNKSSMEVDGVFLYMVHFFPWLSNILYIHPKQNICLSFYGIIQQIFLRPHYVQVTVFTY